MKLYTEEQVIEMLSMTDMIFDNDLMPHKDIISCFKPIELPSDEEIEEIIKPFEFEYTKIGFRACAEWLKNKIQGGNK